MKWTQIVGLVIRREIGSRIFSKPFLIGQVTSVVLIFAVFGLGSVLGGDEAIRIGVVGSQPPAAEANLQVLADATDVEVELSEVADRAAAVIALEEGDLDGVVVDGETLLLDELSEPVIALVTPAWQQASLVDALGESGLQQSEIVSALGESAPIVVEEINPDPDADARDQVAFGSVILMFISIQIAGAYIMLGVFEEKSSKVVELVLSSVPARYLLAGKILGIGFLGLVQVAVLVGSVLIAAQLFASSVIPALSAELLGTAVLWFFFGYLLYGAVFAAGASLAPRQEDAQSTLTPVSIILMISYFAAIFTAADPQGIAARIVSWVPFTAPFAMPGRIAAGDSAWWEIVGSLALTATGAVGVVLLAERIYVRSIIHTDRTLGWREAWSLEQ